MEPKDSSFPGDKDGVNRQLWEQIEAVQRFRIILRAIYMKILHWRLWQAYPYSRRGIPTGYLPVSSGLHRRIIYGGCGFPDRRKGFGMNHVKS